MHFYYYLINFYCDELWWRLEACTVRSARVVDDGGEVWELKLFQYILCRLEVLWQVAFSYARWQVNDTSYDITGNEYGNCGWKNSEAQTNTGRIYLKCRERTRDVMCGLLHCEFNTSRRVYSDLDNPYQRIQLRKETKYVINHHFENKTTAILSYDVCKLMA